MLACMLTPAKVVPRIQPVSFRDPKREILATRVFQQNKSEAEPALYRVLGAFSTSDMVSLNGHRR